MTAKKRKVRNRARDVIGDYYKTNTQYTRENRERQKEQEKKEKGLKNWTMFSGGRIPGRRKELKKMASG